MDDRVGIAQRIGFWVCLLCGGACAAAVFGLLGGENRDAGLHVLGGSFAIALVAYSLLARRGGAGAAVAVVWSLGFGSWFPAWVDRIGPVWRHWLAQSGGTDVPRLLTSLPLPLAIATAGVITGAILYLMTRSGRVALQTTLLSVVVAATPLLPIYQRESVMGGIIAWHIVISASLFNWMLDCVRGGAGLSCAGCGFDLLGISSPVCPGCGRSLIRKQTVVPAGHLPTVMPRPKPAGRWY